MATILLFEPDPAMDALVSEQLRSLGHDVVGAHADQSQMSVADIIILGQPIKHNDPLRHLTVCRAMGFDGAVLTLGPLTDETDKAVGEALKMPLRIGELMDRVNYHLRRRARGVDGNVTIADYKLDVVARQLVHMEDGPVIPLTDKEVAILQALGAVMPESMTREQLLSAVWGYHAGIDTHTLETHIYRLRRKLADQAAKLSLISDQAGYRLQEGS